MKLNVATKRIVGVSLLSIGLAVVTGDVLAAGANWKKGRIFNRMICNGCHRIDDGKVSSPVERTQAEWKAYFAADKHDATGSSNPSAMYYASPAYLETIKGESAAAAKFLEMTEEDHLANVIEFYIHGAKDSDTPARCQ